MARGSVSLSVGFVLLIAIVCISAGSSHLETKSRHRREASSPGGGSDYYKDTDWWQVGQDELSQALLEGLQMGKAKNVIFFLGDGMGINTVTAARIYNEQSRGLRGREVLLAWDKFPHTALARTYNTDYIVPDSAATATAFLCGEKAQYGTVGVNQNVARGDCQATAGNTLKSFFKYAVEEGKAVGIVTTTRITHATPAAAYASVAERDWEADGDVPVQHRGTCPDIAAQLLDDDLNKKIQVLLGGGRRSFYPTTVADPEWGTAGNRADGRNLVDEWVAQKVAMGYTDAQVKYVMNHTDFHNIDTDSVEYLMGLFEPSHMQWETDRTDPLIEKWGEPSLQAMTDTAIKILRKNTNGYVLLVEGARIDMAHHDGYAMRSLNETVSMSDAVHRAQTLTDVQNTLTVVTADHSHAFAMSGSSKTGHSILGLTNKANADDGKPYLALAYTNGPGFLYHRMDNRMKNGTEIPRRDLTYDVHIGEPDYLYDAGIYRDSETHAGEDVAVYAKGPMSHLFHGVHEQNYIAHAMMYASCVGPNKKHCSNDPWVYPGCPTVSSAAGTSSHQPLQAISMLFVIFPSFVFAL